MCRQQMTDEHERWDIDRAIERMERDVERGKIIRKELETERLAVNRDDLTKGEL